MLGLQRHHETYSFTGNQFHPGLMEQGKLEKMLQGGAIFDSKTREFAGGNPYFWALGEVAYKLYEGVYRRERRGLEQFLQSKDLKFEDYDFEYKGVADLSPASKNGRAAAANIKTEFYDKKGNKGKANLKVHDPTVLLQNGTASLSTYVATLHELMHDATNAESLTRDGQEGAYNLTTQYLLSRAENTNNENDARFYTLAAAQALGMQESYDNGEIDTVARTVLGRLVEQYFSSDLARYRNGINNAPKKTRRVHKQKQVMH